MPHTIKSLTITGKCFNGETLDFFTDDKRFLVIYGENGSGKSTISEAFEILQSSSNSKKQIEIQISCKGKDIEDFQNLFVFNESFIERNIKQYHQEGLTPILRIGPEVRLYQQEADKFYEKVHKISSIDCLIESYISRINKFFNSIAYYLNQVQIQWMINTTTEREQMIEYHTIFYTHKQRFQELKTKIKYIIIDSMDLKFSSVIEEIETFIKFLNGFKNYIPELERHLNLQYNKVKEKQQEKIEKQLYCDSEMEEKISNPLNEIDNLSLDIESIVPLFDEKVEIIKNLNVVADKLKTMDRKEPEKISVNLINEYLNYIFCTSDNLRIESSDYYYEIKRDAGSIIPAYLSSGEKNIVALCYFFTEINKDLDKNNDFKKNCLIVLDDPISSLDNNNKIGIYCFLKMMFSQIFKNSESKLVILTHKLDVVFTLDSIFYEIGAKSKFKCFELKDRTLKSFTGKNINMYGKLLERICEYSFNEDEDTDNLVIGNSIRQVLEAYSYFNYDCSINEFFKDSQIMSKLDNKREYFHNSIYRIVLNDESHTEYRIRSGEYFFNKISLSEKRRISKDILALLYILDENHIRRHLLISKKGKESINNIKKWIVEINSKI
ncbi:MAG: AAA family ATPase [Methanosarcinales archaeon]|jgi:wobble nucleotide-excising tRNase|nr:AAA family ATPase [Methanosarcinales archaeon]